MWNYFPKINKTMKVPPSMMTSSWMGSDFTNDDLVKETSLLADYHAKLDESHAEHYLITLNPKEKTPSVWNEIRIWVSKKNLLPFKELYYDERGNVTREMILDNIRTFGKRQMPARMVMTPMSEGKKGHQTIFEYHTVEFDKPLPKGTFSLRNLKKRR
jgi:outer membrane lipoprotein-sorting protein